jgi:hypothetical protein
LAGGEAPCHERGFIFIESQKPGAVDFDPDACTNIP